MKKLSIIVPSYNAESFLGNCLDSLLIGDDSIEIIVVNDGSKDSTQTIAEQYQKDNPNTVIAVSKENSGHGGAINEGLKYVTGAYLKIVDSDDWLNQDSLRTLLKQIDTQLNGDPVDMIIANYVYEKEGRKHKKVIRYTKSLPVNKSFSWDQFKLPIGKYLLMHSIVYRADIIKKIGLLLPTHSFYVDNVYAFVPLEHINSMYYMDINLYRYHIGREEQSVNEKNMIRQIDQQLYVNKILIDTYTHTNTKNKSLKKYMFHYLEIITAVSSVILTKGGTDEHRDKKQELWDYIETRNPELFKDLYRGPVGRLLSRSSKLRDKVTLIIYKIIQFTYGLN